VPERVWSVGGGLAAVVGLGGEGPDQVLAGAGDTAADRADRTPEGLGGFGVAQAQDLGQDEGGPLVGIERSQQVIEIDLAGGIGSDLGPLPVATAADAAASGAAPDLVDAHVAGDAQQPQPYRTVTPEAGERGDRPGVHVLGEVIGALAVDQVGAQAPDIGLGAPHEVGQRDPVATGGPEGQFVHEIVGSGGHGNQMGGWGDR